jgi:uncharacterized protein with GYD domain
MPTFIMLTRVNDGVALSPMALQALEQDVENAIEESCPEIAWRANYAVSGPYDYVDIFDAPTSESAMKVAALVKTMGCARAETWMATEWRDYKALLHGLPMRENGEDEAGAPADMGPASADAVSAEKGKGDGLAQYFPELSDEGVAAVVALQPTGEELETAIVLATGNAQAINPLWPVSSKSHQIYQILTGSQP